MAARSAANTQGLRIRVGRTLALAGLGSMLVSVAGCSVRVGAIAGVSVDASGRPVGVVAVCEGWIDAIVVYSDEGQAESSTLGQVDADRPVRRYATVSLTNFSAGWTVRQPLRTLQPGTEYTLYGGTRSNKWSARHISFSSTDLQATSPGVVLYDRFDRPGSDGKRVRVTAKELERTACDNFGG